VRRFRSLFTVSPLTFSRAALNWWGNEVYTNTLDWQGVSYKMPPPDGFGPTSW
jgi:hypothetical protein